MELPQPQAGNSHPTQGAGGSHNGNMQPLNPASNLAITPLGGTPAIADDSDLIEKEWVIKAKHIVDQTKHNPRLQNQQITRLKADYMKRRYSKDLKVDQE